MTKRQIQTSLIAERILSTLESRQFEKWYGEGGDFDSFITDMEGAPDRETILDDIKQVFNLKLIDL